jgi:hypothetical protein
MSPIVSPISPIAPWQLQNGSANKPMEVFSVGSVVDFVLLDWRLALLNKSCSLCNHSTLIGQLGLGSCGGNLFPLDILTRNLFDECFALQDQFILVISNLIPVIWRDCIPHF